VAENQLNDGQTNHAFESNLISSIVMKEGSSKKEWF